MLTRAAFEMEGRTGWIEFSMKEMDFLRDSVGSEFRIFEPRTLAAGVAPWFLKKVLPARRVRIAVRGTL